MVETHKTVIIGAGPSGIAAAIGHGPEALVLEKGATVGGLASSVEVGGAVFDLGGHSFHSPHQEIKDLIYSSLEMYEQARSAHCYTYGQMIRYPFQKHFHELDSPDIINDCRSGLASVSGSGDATTFDQLLKARFGEGIARHFLTPYNQKLWGTNLSRMAIDWVEERVAGVANTAESPRMNNGKRQALHEKTIVSYPARGGFGEIVCALSRGLSNVRLNTTVIRIDPSRKELHTRCGSTIKWERLISTLPVTELLSIIEGFPLDLIKLSSGLEHISLRLVLVALHQKLDTIMQRIYCADSTSPAHKIVLNNNSSDYLRSLPNHGVMGEISMAQGELAGGEAIQSFIASLLSLQILRSTNQISCIRTIDVKYGYPVPTLRCKQIMSTLKDRLHSYGIHTVGRFGEWDYINADEAMHRGIKLGRALASQT